MIKAIIFDWGGVFTSPGTFKGFIEKYSNVHKKDKEEFHAVLRRYWDLARVNKIKSSGFWKGLAEYLGITEQQARENCVNSFKFKPEMIVIAKELKKKGYKLGLLSNNIEDWLEEELCRPELKGIFDVIVTSYSSRKAKPDLEIFKEIVEKLNIKAEECIYVDDLEKNIPPAVELGMKSILFKQ